MTAQHRDALGRLIQAGDAVGVGLFRVQQLDQNNRYEAVPLEFDEDGIAQPASDETVVVTNLAEPADTPGTLPADTDAVGVDVEGRWVIFVRQAASGVFPARVIASSGGASYTVREQVATGPGTFADKADAADVTACNLAELSLGPGAAVDDDTVVLVTVLTDTGTPPTIRYVFDHPAYAKYLS
ncbi:MAG: hypothetical protein KGY99_06060 [Phycisphaerae bacterium]|nr:hypothetical protein [Phycisphaerae bacterium]